MATDVHSKRCSPSKLELELICSMASEFYANKETEEPGAEALYGSQVHLVGESIIRNGLGAIEFDEEVKTVDEVIKQCDLFDDEMLRLAKLYGESCIKDIEYERKRTGQEPLILIETTLDLSYLIPSGNEKMIGTLDFGYLSKDLLVIEDLKSGRIVKKSGTRNEDGTLEINPQLGAYCSAVIHQYGMLYPIKKIRFVIHQERMNSVSEIEITIDEFKKWESEILIPGVAKIYSRNLEAVPNKFCKYCSGKGCCSKRMEENLKTVKTTTEPSLMTDDQIEELLPRLEEFIKFAEDVKAQAVKRMQNGHKFKHHKLVYASTKRTFTDSDAVAKILIDNGYDAYSKPKVLGITEIQKKLGKEKMSELLGSLITITNGAITAAPLDDVREEVIIEKKKEK